MGHKQLDIPEIILALEVKSVKKGELTDTMKSPKITFPGYSKFPLTKGARSYFHFVRRSQGNLFAKVSSTIKDA